MTPFAADLRRALRYRNQTRPDLVRATGACDEEGRGAARDGTGCVGGGCRRADVPGDEGGSRMTDCKHAVVTMTPVCEDCDSVYVDKDRWVALPTIDPTTPLTAEGEALLAEVHGTQMALTVFPARLRVIELAAARRAIEGSGVVSVEAVAPAINGMLSIGWLMDSLTEPVGWEGKPNPHQWLYDAIVAAGKAVDAALPRPEEPRVLCWYPGCTATPETHGLSVCIGGGTCASHHPFTPEAR